MSLAFSSRGAGVAGTDSQGVFHTPVNSVKNVAQNGIALNQNYPNPAGSTTEFSVFSDHPLNASLAVFDALGRNVQQIMNGELEAGTTSFVINTRDLANGTYFYRLQTPEFTTARAFVVAR